MSVASNTAVAGYGAPISASADATVLGQTEVVMSNTVVNPLVDALRALSMPELFEVLQQAVPGGTVVEYSYIESKNGYHEFSADVYGGKNYISKGAFDEPADFTVFGVLPTLNPARVGRTKVSADPAEAELQARKAAADAAKLVQKAARIRAAADRAKAAAEARATSAPPAEQPAPEQPAPEQPAPRKSKR